MFGWTDLMSVSPSVEVIEAIVPTIVLPFALVGVLLSSLATFFAALFGIDLKIEGPKKLLALVLTPKFLAIAVVFNLVAWGGYKAYFWWDNLPSPKFYIQLKNPHQPSRISYLPVAQAKDHSLADSQRIQSINLEWETKIGSGAFGSPVLTQDSVFIGSDDGYVYELSRADGSTIRKFFIGTEVSPSPLIWNGYLYVGEGSHYTHHARLYQFDLKTGQLRNTFTSKGHIETQATIGIFNNKSILFIAAGKDGLYALDPETLEQIWHNPIGHSDLTPEVENGVVYAGTGLEKDESTEACDVYALDFFTGKVLWRNTVPTSSWTKPVALKDRVCFFLGEIYFNRDYGQVSCYEKETGRPLLAVNFQQTLIGAPVIIDNQFFMTGLLGGVCHVDPYLGKSSWCISFPVEKYAYSSVATDAKGHLIYPSVTQGMLFLNPANGNTENTWMPKNADEWSLVFGTPAADKNEVYFVDRDGRVRKLSLHY